MNHEKLANLIIEEAIKRGVDDAAVLNSLEKTRMVRFSNNEITVCIVVFRERFGYYEKNMIFNTREHDHYIYEFFLRSEDNGLLWANSRNIEMPRGHY